MPTTVPTSVPGRSPDPLTRPVGSYRRRTVGMRPAAISPSCCTSAGGIPERDDDDSGRDGDVHRSASASAADVLSGIVGMRPPLPV